MQCMRLIGCWARPLTQTLRALSVLRIGTHDGNFHCDEALACWILKNTERFRQAEIVRTRDKTVLNSLDVLLDVGGVYDPGKETSQQNQSERLFVETLRFDHRQRDFEEVFDEGRYPQVPLSTAGLIYKHFGGEVIENILQEWRYNQQDVHAVYRRVYDEFVRAIDGQDNGTPLCQTGDGRKAIKVYSDATGLTARVGRLNVNWKSPAGLTEDAQFFEAIDLCGNELTDYARYLAEKWVPARNVVRRSLENASSVSPTQQIMFLDVGCPWKKLMHDLEDDLPIARQIKYCVYFEEDKKRGCRVHAVPVSDRSNTPRLPFPEEWRGLSSEALDAVTGIDGCIFVHKAGFLGIHNNKEGAIAMAERSLEFQNYTQP